MVWDFPHINLKEKFAKQFIMKESIRYEFNEYIREKGDKLYLGLGGTLTEKVTLEKTLNGIVNVAVNSTAAGCQCIVGLAILVTAPSSLSYQCIKYFYEKIKN